MALHLANPSPDWRIFDVFFLKLVSSMFNGTFAVKAHWEVARRAPTQGEFRDDQTDAKVGSTPGAARGVRARSGHLWSLDRKSVV